MNLPLWSAGFAAFALVAYVVLDGFDLGVGVLLLFQPVKASRDHMIDSITPTWDGNETWLIMAGVTLLAGFPLAYGILLPALYLPAITMLLSLGLRGVSFEFRVQMKKYRKPWDTVFGIGSVVAALMEGIILGALLAGIKVEGDQFSGSILDVFHPFSLLCGVTLVAGYMVLGSGWLLLKANAHTQAFAARAIRVASTVLAILFCAVCFYARHIQPGVAAAWTKHPNWLSWLAFSFVVISVCLITLPWISRPLIAFELAIGQFIIGMTAIAVITFPDIVPFRISLWDAAASTASQRFLLTGAAIVAPVVIAYSAFAYWIFRGKTPSKGWEL